MNVMLRSFVPEYATLRASSSLRSGQAPHLSVGQTERSFPRGPGHRAQDDGLR